MAKQKQQMQVTVPEKVQNELDELNGVVTLVAERYGYDLGIKAKRAEMNEHTQKERKTRTETRKAFKEDMQRIIEESDLEAYQEHQKKIKEANKLVAEKSKPFREKMKPLNKAKKYMDTVVIPDALKAIKKPIQPRFNLSEWVQKALEEENN